MKPVARRLRTLPALVANLGLLLAPVPSLGEARLTSTERSASASLDFRIIIPPIMRVLENSHPQQLDAEASGGFSGRQRLVVLSNMKHGFCVQLRLAAPSVEHWQLDVAPEGGVNVQAAGGGYRLCSARPGRYSLVLQHRFRTPADGANAGLHWPVQTDIATL